MSHDVDLPHLFDHARLAKLRHRARAVIAEPSSAYDEAQFLRARIVPDCVDRLSLVQRPLKNVLELDSPDTQFFDAFRTIRPTSHITRAAGYDRALIDNPLVDDGTPLAHHTARYDLIVSLLSLHFANDLPGLLIQIRRALQPDGLFMGALFGGDTLYELRRVLLRAESEITGGAAPRIAPFGQVRDLGALLQRAGFALPVADQDTITVRYQNPLTLLQDVRAMGAGNCMTQSTRPLRRDVLMRAIELYRSEFAQADGKVPATFQMISLSGWAPHDSQQKPLKPGSAKQRLADALGTQEQSSGERAKPD